MDIGLYATSHGTGYRDDTNFYLYSLPANQLLPIETALVAEQAGFPMPMANDASIAILGALVLFLIPNGKGEKLLDWKTIYRWKNC